MNASDFTKSIESNVTDEVFCAYSFIADLCSHKSGLFSYYLNKAKRDGLELQEFLHLPVAESDRRKALTDFALQIIALMELKIDANGIIGFIYNLKLTRKIK